tara:strand:- start:236 stop:652 length:417 start_codon:yes stop_codon:yes gene_type:complete
MPFKNKELEKRSKTISNWKKQGINILNREHGHEVYKKYMDTTNCELCDILLPEKRDLDHDHETGEIRNIVCHKCNMWRVDNKNVQYIKKRFRKDRNKDYYYITIMRNGKRVLSTKTTDEEKAIKIRDNFIKENPHYFL